MNRENESPPLQTFKIHRYNTYECPADGCSGSMFAAVDGIAKCQKCGSSSGDVTQLLHGVGDLNFVHAGPLRGWVRADVAAKGIAGQKPDPANDPFARVLRGGVTKQQDEHAQSELLRCKQIRQSIEDGEQRACAKEEERNMISRQRRAAAQKAVRHAKAEAE